jgi:hypothetical protein
MSIGAISNPPIQSPQKTPEASEVRKSGGDHDGDSDDRGAKAVQAPAAPAVNTSGQTIGQRINVAA